MVYYEQILSMTPNINTYLDTHKYKGRKRHPSIRFFSTVSIFWYWPELWCGVSDMWDAHTRINLYYNIDTKIEAMTCHESDVKKFDILQVLNISNLWHDKIYPSYQIIARLRIFWHLFLSAVCWQTIIFDCNYVKWNFAAKNNEFGIFSSEILTENFESCVNIVCV